MNRPGEEKDRGGRARLAVGGFSRGLQRRRASAVVRRISKIGSRLRVESVEGRAQRSKDRLEARWGGPVGKAQKPRPTASAWAAIGPTQDRPAQHLTMQCFGCLRFTSCLQESYERRRVLPPLSTAFFARLDAGLGLGTFRVRVWGFRVIFGPRGGPQTGGGDGRWGGASPHAVEEGGWTEDESRVVRLSRLVSGGF